LQARAGTGAPQPCGRDLHGSDVPGLPWPTPAQLSTGMVRVSTEPFAADL
jgi:hypothetical protein